MKMCLSVMFYDSQTTSGLSRAPFKEGRTGKETLSYMVSANISSRKNIITVIKKEHYNCYNL